MGEESSAATCGVQTEGMSFLALVLPKGEEEVDRVVGCNKIFDFSSIRLDTWTCW
jgi:hypothetical protein